MIWLRAGGQRVSVVGALIGDYTENGSSQNIDVSSIDIRAGDIGVLFEYDKSLTGSNVSIESGSFTEIADTVWVRSLSSGDATISYQNSAPSGGTVNPIGFVVFRSAATPSNASVSSISVSAGNAVLLHAADEGTTSDDYTAPAGFTMIIEETGSARSGAGKDGAMAIAWKQYATAGTENSSTMSSTPSVETVTEIPKA